MSCRCNAYRAVVVVERRDESPRLQMPEMCRGGGAGKATLAHVSSRTRCNRARMSIMTRAANC